MLDILCSGENGRHFGDEICQTFNWMERIAFQFNFYLSVQMTVMGTAASHHSTWNRHLGVRCSDAEYAKCCWKLPITIVVIEGLWDILYALIYLWYFWAGTLFWNIGLDLLPWTFVVSDLFETKYDLLECFWGWATDPWCCVCEVL